MSPAKRQRREALRDKTRAAVAALEFRGVCWSDWARERGFSLHAVKDIVRDRNPATRGELFEVAARMRAEAARIKRTPSQRIHDLELLADRLDSRLAKAESKLAALRTAVLQEGEAAQASTSEGEA